MDIFRELFQIAEILLAEEDYQATVETALRRLLVATQAGQGFIVVREEGSYRQVFDVDYANGGLSREQRRFSRSLVREAIRERQLIYSPNLMRDERFAGLDSVLALGPCAALVVPLVRQDEVYGCVYLERSGNEGFDPQIRQLATAFGRLAALLIHRALQHETLRQRNRSLERELFARFDFAGIVTQDSAMLRLLERVGQVADSDAPILVLGETGTGKELIAKALHLNSPRRRRAFITVHCAALPGELLEAELFGHTAGAFTGARKERAGRIAAADGGTLFLDEVGEIPIAVQAKLLRFLQFGEIQRLGSDRPEKVDVRVISATHRNLTERIAEGEFREDLYYRLRVLDLELPPLRHRSGDIGLLLDHLLERHWRHRQEPHWTPRARAAVLAHPFPGNVRELDHLVRRLCLLSRDGELDIDLLPEEVEIPTSPSEERLAPSGKTESASPPSRRFAELSNDCLKATKAEMQYELEHSFLEELMAAHGGNVSRAARVGGFHRTFLQKMLARHDLGSA